VDYFVLAVYNDINKSGSEADAVSEDQIKNIFADNLRWFLSQRAMSNVDLADAVKSPKQTVSDWVTGKKMPRTDKMQEIADALHVDPASLLQTRSEGNDDIRYLMDRLPKATPEKAAKMPILAAAQLLVIS